MRSGLLRHRIEVQEATETEDARGGPIKVWKTVAKRQASIRKLKGTEKYHEQRLDSRITHKFTIRFFEDLTPSFRFLFRGRIFHIIGIDNDKEINHKMEVDCQEVGGPVNG